MKQINTWQIDTDQNGAPYTATFGPDDFDNWIGDHHGRVTKTDRQQMLENLIYLAEGESREMTQTIAELRDAINDWADGYNKEAKK